MTGTARREVVVSVSDDEWHVTSGHLSLEMLLYVEYSIFQLGTSLTRSSSADKIANANFLSCARKRLCVGTQVYQIH